MADDSKLVAAHEERLNEMESAMREFQASLLVNMTTIQNDLRHIARGQDEVKADLKEVKTGLAKVELAAAADTQRDLARDEDIKELQDGRKTWAGYLITGAGGAAAVIFAALMAWLGFK